jgi:hypothetical protein
MTTGTDALILRYLQDLEVAVFVLPFVLPVVAAVYLGFRLRARTA